MLLFICSRFCLISPPIHSPQYISKTLNLARICEGGWNGVHGAGGESGQQWLWAVIGACWHIWLQQSLVRELKALVRHIWKKSVKALLGWTGAPEGRNATLSFLRPKLLVSHQDSDLPWSSTLFLQPCAGPSLKSYVTTCPVTR